MPCDGCYDPVSSVSIGQAPIVVVDFRDFHSGMQSLQGGRAH